MHVLFPSNPLLPRQVEPDFEAQANAAREAGFEVLCFDHDALTRGEVNRALYFVRHAEHWQAMVYRGWMLREREYAALYAGLLTRGWDWLTGPLTYAKCHHLPGWYEALQDVTPRSVWVELSEDERTSETLPWPKIWDALAPFGDQSLVLKDWVKSRKHEWHEACFIPCASNHEAVERVTRRFVAGQAENLVGGLVYREWLAFESAGTDERGMPLIQESRWWIANGEPCFVTPQNQAALQSSAPHEWISEMAARLNSQLRSPFFTLDVAQLPTGEWRVIEVGDGQVSGLPAEADALQFYTALRVHLEAWARAGYLAD